MESSIITQVQKEDVSVSPKTGEPSRMYPSMVWIHRVRLVIDVIRNKALTVATAHAGSARFMRIALVYPSITQSRDMDI